MSELTYILGAGASYQSFPIVNTFNKRFNDFIAEYDLLCEDARKDMYEFYGELLLGSEFAKALSSEFDNHQSFDTYFKKLFHQRKNVSCAKLFREMYQPCLQYPVEAAGHQFRLCLFEKPQHHRQELTAH